MELAPLEKWFRLDLRKVVKELHKDQPQSDHRDRRQCPAESQECINGCCLAEHEAERTEEFH